MNLRELFEASLAGTALGGIARSGEKAAGKETEKAVEKSLPAVKAQAKAEVKEKEKPTMSVGMCYGRWNPPHKGHKKAWTTAAENSEYYIGTNQNTEGPDDPLPYNVKIKCMETLWDGVKNHIVPIQDAFYLAAYINRDLQKKGIDPQTVVLKVACSSEEMWLYNGIKKHNTGIDAGKGAYKFADVEWAEVPRIARATNLRNAVRHGDRKAFTAEVDGSGEITADTLIHVAGHQVPFFDLVARYLLQYPEKVKKIKEVNQIVREMKAKRTMTNAQGNKMKTKTSDLDKEYKASMKNMSTMPDQNQSSGSAYLNYRMGVALAGAPDYPTKMAGDTWLGGDPLISTYTEEEFEMVKAASLQVGGGPIENWSGKRSEELPEINKTSTIAKPKRNKYGI